MIEVRKPDIVLVKNETKKRVIPDISARKCESGEEENGDDRNVRAHV